MRPKPVARPRGADAGAHDSAPLDPQAEERPRARVVSSGDAQQKPEPGDAEQEEQQHQSASESDGHPTVLLYWLQTKGRNHHRQAHAGSSAASTAGREAASAAARRAESKARVAVLAALAAQTAAQGEKGQQKRAR